MPSSEFRKLIDRKLSQPFRVLLRTLHRGGLEIELQSLFILEWSGVILSIKPSTPSQLRGTLSKYRKKAVDRHNKRTGVISCNLNLADCIVVVRTRGPRTKIPANWVGPRRVVQALSDNIFRVDYLITQETEDIHVSRIDRYADGLVGTPVQMNENADFSDRICYSVDKVNDIREENGSFEASIS